MQTRKDVWGPDALKALQQIFDSVLDQLAGQVDVGNEQVRDEISRLVIQNMVHDLLDVEAVRQGVVTTFKNARATTVSGKTCFHAEGSAYFT